MEQIAGALSLAHFLTKTSTLTGHIKVHLPFHLKYGVMIYDLSDYLAAVFQANIFCNTQVVTRIGQWKYDFHETYV